MAAVKPKYTLLPPTELLRQEFLKLLTEDSETKDARRREFNQAIFMPDQRGAPDYATHGVFFSGKAVWSEIDLLMVLEKFDKAVKNLTKL